MPTMRECPVCGVRVKLENLESHLRKVHPRVDVTAYLTEDDKTKIKIARKKEKKTARPFEDRERKKWALAAIVIVAIVVVVIVLLTAFPPVGPGCDLEGEDYIDFTRGDVEGGTYHLGSHVGPKPILLEFFYTECGACISMAPTMNELYAHYGWGEQVEFVSISSDSTDSVERVRIFQLTHESNWTHIWDSSGIIGDDYCLTGTPTFVLIDTDGKIAKWWYKTRDLDTMISIIDPVLYG